MATRKIKQDEREDIDPAAVEVWTSFFDNEKTSIKDALGHFLIDVDPDPDGDDPEVPYELFTLRPRQAETLSLIQDIWRLKRRAARIVCLKSRRYGMSTFYFLLGLERILRIPGYRVLLIAQDDVMARTHFQRLRATFSQIPRWILKERGIEVVKDTDNQIILRHEGYKESEFRVAPAKRNALGRGDRYNFLILTEFPMWPPAAKADLSGVLAACRNVPGNIIVFESTAKGYDAFHRRYMRAKKHRSDYRAQFVAAFEHPGNRKRFATAAEEDEFIKTIGTLPEFGIEDELVLFRRLTIDLRWTPHDAAEHLNWRRTEITDNCEGNTDFYHRENPNTDAEAFQGTGLPLFRKELLEGWRDLAEAREAAGERGRLTTLSSSRIEFMPDQRGALVVFEKPQPGRVYAFGADVSSGIAKNADGKRESDYSVMIVKDVLTKVTVARLRLHMPPGEYAREVFRLACWYNGARGYIERSINDAGVCIDRFEDEEWGEFSGMSLLLSQKRLVKSDFVNVRANVKWTPGFQTTKKTKPALVEKIGDLVRDTGLPDGVKPCPWDLVTLDELGRFERDDRTGSMEAAEGHDDAVMAEGMALEAIERIIEDGIETGAKVEITAPKTGDEILAFYCKVVNGHREEEQAPVNHVEGLPDF